MTQPDSRDIILDTATKLLALQGAAGAGIRDIARASSVAPSVIYHHFGNKDGLLRAVFDRTNTRLGELRNQLPEVPTAGDLLAQRIRFQLDHAEEVVAVLKYYLAYRHTFVRLERGVLPEKAYLHMLEVVLRGVGTGEFRSHDVVADAQVMTHAVNGFLLEYYPEELSDGAKEEVVIRISSFLMRSLEGGERA
jgi:AcrR family transcriptional regulator